MNVKKICSAFPILIFGLCFFSCKSDHPDQSIDVNDITVGPIVHDTLSPEQIEKIRYIHETFSEVDPSTLESAITDFQRDKNPDNEIAIWLSMADAYKQFVSNNPSIDLNKKKEAFGLVLMRSMVDEAEAKERCNLKLLTDKEIDEIFSYCDFEAKPLVVEKK